MDDIDQKREELKKTYPDSRHWHNRVDKMSSAQVIAIYFKMKKQGKIG